MFYRDELEDATRVVMFYLETAQMSVMPVFGLLKHIYDKMYICFDIFNQLFQRIIGRFVD